MTCKNSQPALEKQQLIQIASGLNRIVDGLRVTAAGVALVSEALGSASKEAPKATPEKEPSTEVSPPKEPDAPREKESSTEVSPPEEPKAPAEKESEPDSPPPIISADKFTSTLKRMGQQYGSVPLSAAIKRVFTEKGITGGLAGVPEDARVEVLRAASQLLRAASQLMESGME